MAEADIAAAKSFRAIHRWARIAPRKARLIADLVRVEPGFDDVFTRTRGQPRRVLDDAAQRVALQVV